ncbi:prephenate dehydrogenase/arogenate dehydrogenase family protein, partial [Klebsiella pneumoniae]|nr:prephenate dehydrogenase/arogenate dehydrogenase family protein [Klebsiella pneumoniae]
DFNQDSVNAAVLAKVLHNGFTDVYQGITSADVILLAVPVKSVHAILQAIKHAMMSGDVNKECIITDVGSTKVNILED